MRMRRRVFSSAAVPWAVPCPGAPLYGGCQCGGGRQPYSPRRPALPGVVLVLSIVTGIFLMMSLGTTFTSAQFLEGAIEDCVEANGTLLHLPGISEDPCYNCYCLDGMATCIRERCPSTDGCHYILYSTATDTCCDTCKGCTYNKKDYHHGSEWTEKADPCKVHHCHAGVLTVGYKQCHTVDCLSPRVVEGQCCHVCRGCSVGGVQYKDGAVITSPKDGCAQCTCQAGSLTCQKSPCPVLNCPADHVVTVPGACCASCAGWRAVYAPPGGSCLYLGARRQVYANTSAGPQDPCYTCVCMDGTLRCDRKVCPTLDCVTDDVIHKPETCCPRCRVPHQACRWRDRKYRHGSVWLEAPCRHCSCSAGVVHCRVEFCNRLPVCLPNTRLARRPGQCCPQCIDNGAVCTVFGDPHYKTFDGRIFNFQGQCDYLLTSDCGVGRFAVVVKNRARLHHDFAWTKSVRIRLDDTRVYLLQNLRVKVNSKRAALPYRAPGGVFTVTRGAAAVTLWAARGLRVVWDGDSYLEVAVPPRLNGGTCGLCGNYNRDRSDDFQGGDGRVHVDSKSFGDSWRVGGARACAVRSGRPEQNASCATNSRRHRKAECACAVLHTDVYAECREILNVTTYHTNCVTDMCDCPRGRTCHCATLEAYARACSRLTAAPVPWTGPGLCPAAEESKECPKRATWKACTQLPCPVSCENYDVIPIPCKDTCNSPTHACMCRPGYVLHRSSCVNQRHCRRLLRNNRRRAQRRKGRRKQKRRKNKKTLILL